MNLRRSLAAVAALAAVITLVVLLAGQDPEPAGASGQAEAEVLEVDDGLIYLVSDGMALRIQQPRAAELAELEADGATVGGEVARLAVTDEPTGSTFVIVPPDGPDARLHLLVDDVLHPVVTGTATLDDVVDLEEAPIELFQRLAVAP